MLTYPVIVIDLCDGKQDRLSSDRDVWSWSQVNTPWVMAHHPNSVEDLIEMIDSGWRYIVDLPEDEIQSSIQTYADRLLTASRLFSDLSFISDPKYRKYAVMHENDHEGMALSIFGLEPSPEARASLVSISKFTKSEDPAVLPVQDLGDKYKTPKFDAMVRNLLPEGKPVADFVRNSIRHISVRPVKLGGKHSAGMLLATDPNGGPTVWMLKPGSGRSPALGAEEVSVPMANREVAYANVAGYFGLENFVQPSELLDIEGVLYAAERWIPEKTTALSELVQVKDPPVMIWLQHMVEDGTMHRLAAMDFVLGNVDRHGGNILVTNDREGLHLNLIDHGSSMAGASFAPQTDQNTFTPFYLRYITPDYARLAPDQKLAVLPRVGEREAVKLGIWVRSIDTEKLSRTIRLYDIDPGSILDRLKDLKNSVLPMDETINRAWAVGLCLSVCLSFQGTEQPF